ncbi:hypothetical protein B0J17DRAFT_628047 [Rhizoctonia solani]|nr:hypothetical protein B0J17DRAFT_628047 [Rhizoctonia solani]
MPQLIRRISQSNAVQFIGNIVHVAPNLGYFSSMHREALPAPSEAISFQIPLPLDNIVVLAGRISSRRSRRLLTSTSRNWFIEAMWEGLKRLQTVHERNGPVDREASPEPNNPHLGIPALVDDVMPTFGASLLHFHHKVLKIQQKRDHSMSASLVQKNIVRQEIAERNQDILLTQAGWDAVEQEKEELRRKANQLQNALLEKSLTMH